ncbi:MAG: ATP-binding cassette domain-containing protein, partial [Pseudomonadota bacterium]
MEAFMLRRFERLIRTSAGLINRAIRSSDQAQMFAGLLGNVTIVTMASVGAVYAVAGDLTVGSLAACSMLAGRTVQPVLRVAGLWNEFQHTRLAVGDARTIFALPPLASSSADTLQTNPPPITLSSTTYIYPKNGAGWNDVSLRIGAGEIISLCGPGGVGKSTLLKMIAGLTLPQSGEVTVSGMPADVFRTSVVNSVGYVSAETAPLQGTIMENLTLFGMGTAQDVALSAARQIGIEEEVDRFPDGYETPMGGRAVERMPAGLVQRILIARAMAQQPSVLILDEAQSFFDSSAHARLCECLIDLRGMTTVILATNHPDYVALSDRVFDLTPGKISLRNGEASGHRISPL